MGYRVAVKKKVPATTPIPSPATSTQATAQHVAVGVPISPLNRLRIISPGEWEDFVVEWVDGLRSIYTDVQRCGSSGDMGRDVIGIVDAATWDNYQCKHYKDPLSIADILPELAKLICYTHAGEYTYPRRYNFIAPQGAGTQLINILAKSQDLKDRLLKDWGDEKVPHAPSKLDEDLRKHVASADFTIFHAPTAQHLVDEHSKTRWHAIRFGGGLPPRPKTPVPPASPDAAEVTYIRALLDAYADHKKQPIAAANELGPYPELAAHFARQREDFYSAESLRAFSRDNLPPQSFESLQDDLYRGVVDICGMDHMDGYRCVLQVTQTARQLPLASHALSTHIFVSDRGGICHQLANDGRLRWIKQ